MFITSAYSQVVFPRATNAHGPHTGLQHVGLHHIYSLSTVQRSNQAQGKV